MKFRALKIFMLFSAIFCAGCGGEDIKKGFDIKEITKSIFRMINNQGNGFGSNRSKNQKTGEAIIDCLKTKDAEKLYALFSESAKSDVPCLKDDIKKFFSLYDGEIINYKETATSTKASTEYGDKSFEYCTDYTIFINNIEYNLFFINTTYNSFSRQDEGVRTIRLIKKEDEAKYFEYIDKMKPGVFIPDY